MMKVIKYRGVDIGRVLAIPLYGRVWSNLYKAIFHVGEFDVSGIDNEILIIYSHVRSKRSDYLEIINNLMCLIEDMSPALVIMKPKVSARDKILLIKHLFGSVSLFRDVDGEFLYKLYLIVLVARVKTNIDRALSFLENSRFKVLLTFSDAHEIDNMLAQCANILGKTTVTLQHGQYNIANDDVPDNMLLKNIVSDYLCAWGGATCNEFNKVGNRSTTVLPLGSLRTYMSTFKEYTLQRLLDGKNKKIICLMLNADNCITQNIEMIGITNDFCIENNYSYFVRFHPRSNKSYYTKLLAAKYLGEYSEALSDKIAFSITYTSGVIVELLVKGQLFFLYQDEAAPEIFRKSMLTFKDYRQLMNRLDELYKDKKYSVMALNERRDYFVNTSNVGEMYLSFFKRIT